VMLGRLSMVAGGVCQVLRGLLVVFSGFLRHLCSSANAQLTTCCNSTLAGRNGMVVSRWRGTTSPIEKANTHHIT
jgi:hypothetical protein